MSGLNSLLQQLDKQLEILFSGWNIYTTLICGILVLYVAYPLFFSPEPDLHPFLLARQSSPSYVRQPGESAVYRALDTPHGYPLRKGLNVKDAGAPKWTSGRDGDLRDIWQQAVKGSSSTHEGKAEENGRLLSVLGREELIHHEWNKLTKDLNAVGCHIQDHGGKRVAIYLPNSMEMLVSLFASVLHGLTPILLPYNTEVGVIAGMLKTNNADCLVAAAGSLPVEELLNQHSGLRQVIWVAERSSRHMDWNEVPEGVGGKAEIAVWHEIVDEKGANASSELPATIPTEAQPNIVIVSAKADSSGYTRVAFAQKNLVAAVAAHQSAFPRSQRFENKDVVSLLAPLTDQYTFVVALAALYSNASLALTSVAGPATDYEAAFRGIQPTVLVATSATLSKFHSERMGGSKGLRDKITHWNKARTLAAGNMPITPGKLRHPRLILTYTSSTDSSAPLTSAQMFDLRIFTGAHIAYAFTDTEVAGAISQTNVFDYGHSIADGERPSHFGPPLSCVELKLIDSPDRKVTDDSDSAGWLVIEGPAVVEGKTTVRRLMTMSEKNTLSHAM